MVPRFIATLVLILAAASIAAAAYPDRPVRLIDPYVRLIAVGSDPVGSTTEEFSAYVKSELARWGKIIRENNIRGE